MTTQERLASYKRDMEILQLQKQELEEALERLQIDIDNKQLEIDECEADLLNPEYPEN